jgi:hypothetical protein
VYLKKIWQIYWVRAKHTYQILKPKNRLLKFSLLLRFSEYFEVDINSLITEADFNEFDHNSQVMKEATKFTSDYNRWLDTGIDPDAFKKRQREKNKNASSNVQSF